MILEYGLPDNGVIRLTPLLPPGAELRRLPNMRRVESLASAASGVLLGLTAPPTEALVASLRTLRTRNKWLPIVVAGPEHGEGLAPEPCDALLQAGVDRVISWSLLGRRDVETMSVWRQMPLLRLATVVHHASHLPDAARGIMVRAIAAVRPVANVAVLAGLGGLHRASLSRVWSRSSREMPSAGTFVDWMQLLHAAVRKDAGRTWRGVALELGIRPSSIARMAKRVLGHTLSEYDAKARTHLFERFLREMVAMTNAEVRRHAPIAPPLSAIAIRSATRLGFESLQLESPAPRSAPVSATPAAAAEPHVNVLRRGPDELLNVGGWMV